MSLKEQIAAQLAAQGVSGGLVENRGKLPVSIIGKVFGYEVRTFEARDDRAASESVVMVLDVPGCGYFDIKLPAAEVPQGAIPGAALSVAVNVSPWAFGGKTGVTLSYLSHVAATEAQLKGVERVAASIIAEVETLETNNGVGPKVGAR